MLQRVGVAVNGICGLRSVGVAEFEFVGCTFTEFGSCGLWELQCGERWNIHYSFALFALFKNLQGWLELNGL